MPEVKINNILYATDFSESSVPACDYALTLAKLTGATIHILHVIGELIDERRGRLMPDAFAILEKEVQEQSVKELKIFCDRYFGEEVNMQSEIVIGNPFQEIIEHSKSINADLVVMGTHGRTGLEHVIVGSTAERVVRKSEIPVLTVRSNS